MRRLSPYPHYPAMAFPVVLGVAVLFAVQAYAQTTAVAVTSTPISLVAILNTLINATVPVVIALFGYFLQSHMKDQQAATVLASAVKNSLGAIQNQATGAVTALNPSITVHGLSPAMASGLSYALDHAGDEMKRLGVTQDMVVAKIAAQIGLSRIPDPPTAETAPPLPNPVVAPATPSISPTLPVAIPITAPAAPTTIITP